MKKEILIKYDSVQPNKMVFLKLKLYFANIYITYNHYL